MTRRRQRYLTRRVRARIFVQVELEAEPWYAGSLIRYCERLDEQDDFRDLAFSTTIGAARAAARKLGRYDATSDEVVAVPRATETSGDPCDDEVEHISKDVLDFLASWSPTLD